MKKAVVAGTRMSPLSERESDVHYAQLSGQQMVGLRFMQIQVLLTVEEMLDDSIRRQLGQLLTRVEAPGAIVTFDIEPYVFCKERSIEQVISNIEVIDLPDSDSVNVLVIGVGPSEVRYTVEVPRGEGFDLRLQAAKRVVAHRLAVDAWKST